MKYTVSVTLSIEADNETDAYKEYIERVRLEAFDSDSIEIEREEE